MTIYTLYDKTGESQSVRCCAECAKKMPLVDNDLVFATPAEDDDLDCEFCSK